MRHRVTTGAHTEYNTADVENVLEQSYHYLERIRYCPYLTAPRDINPVWISEVNVQNDNHNVIKLKETKATA